MSLSRRGFLRATYVATAAATVVTVGQTVTPLKQLSLLAPRVPDIGPQGLPVNRSAHDARIEVAADYRLLVLGGSTPLSLSLEELQAMPQHTVRLPIACVEGWSVMAAWSGVRVRDLLDRAGVGHDRRILVDSLEAHGTYRSSILDRTHARDSLTLLALRVHGEQLALDHGFPARLIAPNRPGVLQTKWVTRVSAL